MKRKILLTFALALSLSATSCSKEESLDYSYLNTNPDDIRAMDFYNYEVTEEEFMAQPYEDLDFDASLTQLDKPVSGDVIAIIETNMGTIKIKLLPEVAPKAVQNFVEHSLNDYYDGIIFHRVINDFMIQTGDPLGNGSGGESIWGQDFANEISVNARHFSGAVAMANRANNVSNSSQFYIVDDTPFPDELTLEYKYYRENQDIVIQHSHDSNVVVDENGKHEGDITIGDLYSLDVIDHYYDLGGAPYLDFGYTVFGQVYEGLEIVNAISEVSIMPDDTGMTSKPINDIVIDDIIIGIYE